MYQKEVENLTAQMFNLEQQSIVLEGSILNNQVFNTMKTNKNTLKHINKKINADTVEDLMDNINTQINEVEEVNQVISQPFDDEDDYELLKELESDSESEEEHKVTIQLPNVPENVINNDEEEKALNDLEKMMA